jgi:hypothetical protein
MDVRNVLAVMIGAARAHDGDCYYCVMVLLELYGWRWMVDGVFVRCAAGSLLSCVFGIINSKRVMSNDDY